MFNIRSNLLYTLIACLLAPVSLAEDYPPQIKQILERRCMVCHGCYDAPCQLKLDAWEGLQRGASKDTVYDGARLLTANLTRLFVDATTTEQWREKGFYPVLDDAEGDGKDNVIQRILELKQQHPLPEGGILPDSFDLSLNRNQQCPKPEEFDSFAKNYPLWGMPYGFPGLRSTQYKALADWLRQGAPGVKRAVVAPLEAAEIEKWEAYFNRGGVKEQLVSRYIFEHLFIGDIYFPDVPGPPQFFKLVRSRTPAGQAIDVIATRRPYDSPGQGAFFYRLQPLRTSVMAKRHMPYALGDTRMERWNELFFQADYEVINVPGYEPELASNPFVVYRDLPVEARYKFMLDEAQFTIMGYIKGPVCRGQVALNVIDDHFWVVFADPDQIDPEQNADFLASQSANMRLPVPEGNLLISLVEWRKYARGQREYLKAKSRQLDKLTNEDPAVVNFDLIWDGDGSNDNASLTIFRHTDSASVVKGLVGQTPKTAWVISYSLLERIHYLLVAGFDVYGNVAHQLETRRYMDFLRMEGEYNFLLFMPEDKRLELRNFWYREANSDVKAYVLGKKAYIHAEPDIRYRTSNPVQEFFRQLEPRLAGASAPRYQPVDPHLAKLQTLSGRPFSLMPDVSFVQVFDETGGEAVYTIIHNSAFLNNTQLFQEERRRLPVEDSLTVVKGFIGSYPNMFFQMPEDQLSDFVAAIEAIKSEADYARLVDIYGVRRTAPWFWKLSDSFYDYYQQKMPVEAGVFDLNRYENR
tara:strand:+ start:178009 stop:180261 length:2253 start_codon:yes stop_codon:yes gene_type:complete